MRFTLWVLSIAFVHPYWWQDKRKPKRQIQIIRSMTH